MNVALTGATGFLGRYILRRLAGDQHRLRCWKRPTSNLRGLESVATVDWRDGQLGDVAAARNLVAGMDAVVHAALERPAASSFRGSGDADVVAFVQTNLIGTLQLMQEAKRAGVERFVFISTCAVHELILDDRPLDETHPTWPTTHYGAHKAALEAFVSSYGIGDGWSICSLRPCGIYGLAAPPSDSKYHDLVGRVVAGEPIASAKGGKEVHAADVAKAVALLLAAPPESIAGQAFNCCDRYISEEEVARIAKEFTGSSSRIEPLAKGPKHQIETDKLRSLGMEFGGEALLRETVQQLVDSCK